MLIELIQDALQADAITHGGKFHADEVVSTVILGKSFDRIRLCRVNSMPSEYNKNAIVYDIGGEEFDHHQKNEKQVRPNGVPYASSGLIWRKFGQLICDSKELWQEIDEELIQGIDAADNRSIPRVDYPVDCINLSKMIGLFNLNWDDEGSNNEAFIDAVNFAETIFDKIYANANSRLRAKDIVENAIEKSENHIMVLNQYVPWQEFVFRSNNKKAKDLHFVVSPAVRGGYNWQCVPDVYGGYGQRKTVPLAWKGLKGENLQKETGISTAIFCHSAGFIGGAETFEDAYKMAVLAENS